MTRAIASGGKIHFNLSGMRIAKALAGDPQVWVGRYTAWELQQIVLNPGYRVATIFYQNGKSLSPAELAAIGL